MDNTDKINKLVAIVESGDMKKQVTKVLAGQEELDYEIVDMDKAIDIESLVLNSLPDIILIEHQKGSQKGLDILDGLSLNNAEIPALAILQDDDSSEAQRTLMAGARAFILSPFTKVNLLTVVRRVMELQGRNLQSKVARESSSIVSSLTMGTFTVFSPRGGVGCSTIAVNLALSIMEKSQKSVLLFDGKQYFGHVDVLLNIRSRNSIADLVPHASNLDMGLIKDVVVTHDSGLHVLLAPPSMQIAQGIRPEDIYNVIVGLQGVYDYVIIDAGNSLNENTVTLLDSAFRLLLVLKPDLASLRDARQFLEIAHSLGYPIEKTLMVLNEADSKGGLRAVDVENALQRKLFATIPQDLANAQRSLNRGIPLNIRYPKSPITKELNDIGNKLIGLVNKEMSSSHVSKNQDRAKQDALKKSSLFG